MGLRFAFDVGMASIGWCVFRTNSAGDPTAIVKTGVRIFSDGRNAKDGASLAVTRRQARAMRRRRDRLLKRKARMLRKLIEFGFFPEDEAQRKALEHLNPYALRAKGLDQALTPFEFGRAVFHINQRRGFQSNRKADREENDGGVLKAAIAQVRAVLDEGGARTAGELMWQRLQAGLGVRARFREKRVVTDGKSAIHKSYDLYVDRAMVLAEFDALWAVQAAFNPALYHQAAYEALRDTLSFQRDLRPVKPGRCTLLPEQERAPQALPSAQRFRILQEVNHLRLLYPDLREAALTRGQRDAIVALLEASHKVTFQNIRKKLKLGGDVRFNLEDGKRSELKGNATSAALARKGRFGPAWHGFDEARQDEIVWQLLTQESEEKLLDWLCEHTGVDAVAAQAIANAGLPTGFGRLSCQALQRIVPALRADVVSYDKAVQAAGFRHHSDLAFDFDYEGEDLVQVGERVDQTTGEIKPIQAFRQLPYYGRALQRHVGFGSGDPQDPEEKRYGKIANPTVHIGLNQLRVLANALVRQYGLPTEIVVELARELKQNREQKIEIQRTQASNQKRNARIRREIADILGISEERVKQADIQKWILWEELSFDVADRRCPYSGVQINARSLLSEEVEIEHILPFSRTLDDSLNNKTVAIRYANRIKRNRTPAQARADFENAGWTYEGILQRAESMPRAKRYRFAEDGYERWLREDKDFLARALNDTSYLARLAKAYLSLLCPRGTWVIPGKMTAMLRAKFGLNDLLGLHGVKNRNDHRHHAVDACVIGITDRGMLKRFADASSKARDEGLMRLVEEMPLPWPTYRAHVKRAVLSIWVSHRPDHGHEGSLMEDTAHGIGKDGSIKQRDKEDSGAGREIKNLIRISAPSQPQRHGVGPDGQALPYKGYVSGSNYCMEIGRDEQGKWVGQVVSTFEAYRAERQLRRAYLAQHGKQAQVPPLIKLLSPARTLDGKPLVMRLMKNDAVRLDLEGRVVTMRVVKISGNGQVFMAPLHEANVDARNREKDDPFKYESKRAGSFQKAKARRVTVSPIGVLRDPGFQG